MFPFLRFKYLWRGGDDDEGWFWEFGEKNYSTAIICFGELAIRANKE